MRTHWIGLLGFIVISTAVAATHAQEAAEQFIPLGKSPGVSGISSYIGEITAVDARKRIITISGDKGSRSVSVTDRTKIWVDRSKYKAANLVGAIDDCRKGRQVEVRMQSDQPHNAAWIKVVPEKPR